MILPENYDLTTKPVEYVPPRLGFPDMATLKRLVGYTNHVDELAKQIIIWMIDQSEFLTRRIMLYIPDGTYAVSRETLRTGVSYIANGIQGFLRGEGTNMGICAHHGRLVDGNLHDSKGFTIWISFFMYDRGAEELSLPPLEELRVIGF